MDFAWLIALFTISIAVNIIQIIFDIGIFILQIIDKKEKPKNKKPKFNVDEYLNSLEFNTKLDSIIISLLGKHSDDDIVKITISILQKANDKASYIDKDTLSKYIEDVLLNYGNNYEQNDNEEPRIYTNDREYKAPESNYYDPARDFSSNLNTNKEIDLGNVMRDFYN